MFRAFIRRFRASRTNVAAGPGHVVDCAVPCDAACQAPCALASLPVGVRAVIVRIACPHDDIGRLRVLGVFEGAPVTVVDRRSGVLLDVRGSRLALATSLAAAILAVPVVP